MDIWYNGLPLHLNEYDSNVVQSVTKLSSVPKKRTNAGDLKPTLSNGLYCLTEDVNNCRSFVSYVHRALSVPRRDFESLWALGTDESKVKRTQFMGSLVNRRQATFGAGYSFSGQKNTIFNIPENEFPAAVQMALEDARSRVGERESVRLNGVHVNWYPDGNAGVNAHADDEPHLVVDAPIFSYTLLESEETAPRGFQIYMQDGKTQVADIPLFDGDLIIMGGEMQRHFKHGVKKSAAKAFQNHRRINITVRAFR